MGGVGLTCRGVRQVNGLLGAPTIPVCTAFYEREWHHHQFDPLIRPIHGKTKKSFPDD